MELLRGILDIAQKVGYTLRAAARALASKKTKIIGVVIPFLKKLNLPTALLEVAQFV